MTAPVLDDTYQALLARLSHQSVVKHFDAYGDIAWDDPEYAIDPDDDRWRLTDDDTLGRTAWYQGLPPERRRRLAIDIVASTMKTGLQFESVLKRGLLEYAFDLPNGSPEYRYAYHEIIEEAQHSLMFQEFVNRSGYPAEGMSRGEAGASRFIATLGRRFPALFFVFVLGGEDPVDHLQRRLLRSRDDLPPILERIMRIHVTEEARHLSFARHHLRRVVPQLSRGRRAVLAAGAPLILSQMAAAMMQPDQGIVRRHNVPESVVREAFTENDDHRDEVIASLRKVRELCEELGLVGPFHRRLWKRLGLG